MPHLLGADRVHLTLGTRTLLDGVSLGVDDGQRIGVVGPNGAGKSTLLRVLAGSQTPDDGRVTRAGGTRVALLDQRDDLGEGTVLDVVHGTADAHEWASDARVRAVHTGLLADVALDAPVAQLSGGQRRRVALAALLVRDDEVLGRLTPMERRVVELVGQGLANREIGDELGIAEKTVKNHVTSVLSKMGLQRRTQVVAWATRRHAASFRG